MGRYNILLMDEPSNFLDLPGLEALEGQTIAIVGPRGAGKVQIRIRIRI